MNGVVRLLAIMTAIAGLCAEAAVVLIQYQEAQSQLEVAKAAKQNQKGLADLKREEAEIEAQSAAVSDKLKAAEAELARQKAITERAAADAAARIKSAEALRKTFDAKAEQAKARYALQNLENEIKTLEQTAEEMREPMVILDRYDYYGLAVKMPPLSIIRPRS